LGFIRFPKAASASGCAFIAPFGRLLFESTHQGQKDEQGQWLLFKEHEYKPTSLFHVRPLQDVGIIGVT
jgi:hypothetical protein